MITVYECHTVTADNRQTTYLCSSKHQLCTPLVPFHLVCYLFQINMLPMSDICGWAWYDHPVVLILFLFSQRSDMTTVKNDRKDQSKELSFSHRRHREEGNRPNGVPAYPVLAHFEVEIVNLLTRNVLFFMFFKSVISWIAQRMVGMWLKSGRIEPSGRLACLKDLHHQHWSWVTISSNATWTVLAVSVSVSNNLY